MVRKNTNFAKSVVGADSNRLHPPNYRPEIDGLRALAVLVVMVNHLHDPWLPGGFLGVDLFFVISGYVVTASLVRRREVDGWRRMMAGFYARRFRRLLPALLFMVLGVAIVFTLFVSRADDAYAGTIRTGLTSLLGFSNIHLLSHGDNYFGTGSKYNAFLHTWSLGVEEQFYLFWPLLVLLCGVGFASTRRRNIFALLLITVCLAIGSLALYFHLGFNTQASFYLMPSRFWELASGALVCLLQILRPGKDFVRARSQSLDRCRSFLDLGLLGCLLILIALPVPLATAWKPIFVAASAGLLASLKESSPLGRLTSLPPFLLVGVASYSLYLWHWPLIVLFRWTLGVNALTILPLLVAIALLAALSFIVEKRFRYGRSIHGIARPLAIYPLATLVTGGFVFGISHALADTIYLGRSEIGPENFSVIRSIRGTSIATYRCFLEPNAPLAASHWDLRCLARPHANSPTLFLEGDSLSHSMVPTLDHLLSAGFNVSFFARGGCVMPHMEPWPDNRQLLPRYKLCKSHSAQREDSVLRRIHPGDQLILVNANAYVMGPRAEASYQKEVSELAGKLERKQAGLILFSPLPIYPERSRIQFPLSLCFREWFRPDRAIPYECNEISISRDLALQNASALRRLQLELEGKHSNLHVFDPFPLLCPPGQDRCSTHRNGNMLYADGIHLTHAGALAIYPAFRDALKAYGVYPRKEQMRERARGQASSSRSNLHGTKRFSAGRV